jgi:PAS domain S-box-containing protein
VVRPNGEIRYVLERAKVLRDDAGNTIYVMGTVHDITERKHAEEKDRAQLVALESAANGIVITDRKGIIEWINPAWSALTGYSKEEVIGKNPRILKSGKQPDEFYKRMWETILSGKVWRGELVNKRKDGTLYNEEETIAPVLDEHGEVKIFIAVKQDITERKQAEKILQARLRLNSYSFVSEVEDFLQKVLDEAEMLTESHIGFFHFVEGDQKTIRLEAWSTNTLENMCKAEGQETHYPVDSAGVWADAIRDKMPHIYNDYSSLPASHRKGLPDGHAPVARFVSVPLIKDGNVVAIMGVGNKIAPYGQSDVDVLSQLLSDTWDMIMRKVTEKALARTNLRLQSLRLIDHALLGAGVEGGAADLEALRHLSALVPCGRINIIALDEISDSARFTARAVGTNELSVNRMDQPVSLGDLRLSEMREGEVMVTQLEAEKINSLEKELYEIGGRSLVKAPLIVQGKLIGILALSSADPDFFTAEHLEIIADVSAQLALSLHHNNLLNEIRRHAEQLEQRVRERTFEIEATRQRLELAVNAGEIGVWEVNFKENRAVWDYRMHLIHGTTPDDFDDSVDAWWRMIHPQDVKQSQRHLNEALTQTGLFIDEHRILRPDGSMRHVTANAVVLYDTDSQPERLIGVNVDVTERRQAEEAMRRANLEMERALRIKDEFLANMSHELRTPLNAIMGISESLLEQTAGALNEKQQKYISTVNESGAHLLSLINDILDLSKIEAGRMELNFVDVPVKSLFESGFRMVKEMAQKKNISITFDADERAQTVRGDSRRLLQLLVNLLSNAVKFTPAGGRAGVRAELFPDVDEIHFTVWDTGIGIAEEDMPRLFQPFVQLDSSLAREHSGTGLGLMLVMQMARMHGGNVAVQSKPGEGSRFTISLPWSQAGQDAAAGKKIETAESNLPVEKSRAGNILLVEDTESVVILLSDYLRARGHRLSVARDGLNGLAMARADLPDLILLDVQMPGMDGFEVIEKMRADQTLKDTHVIALTALAMPGDRERCLAAGMNDYISKPIHLKKLARMIELHLQNTEIENEG